jgi:hypothetical protein
MADLHHPGTPDRNTGIDTVGWVFLAVASFVIIVAGMIAYEAHEDANAPVSHIVAR